jgi:hypothetical protein
MILAWPPLRALPYSLLVVDFEPSSSHVSSVVDRAALGQVSSEYFGFPCHSFIPPTAPQSSPSTIQGWYNRSINGRSNSGLGSTPAP